MTPEIKDELKKFPWELNDRIPSTTYAEHYDLYLHPNLEQKTFQGNVKIRINSTEKSDFFVVHSKNLTINSETLSLQCVNNGLHHCKDVHIAEAFPYLPNEFFVVRTEDISPGLYELYLEFQGTLGGKIVGFYYSEYSTKSRGIRSLSTSKFEPTYARQAFPCFDEPSFRSTYSLTLIRPTEENYIGLSNMPVKSEKVNSPSTGLTEVHFEKSVSMVTYLVCFIVSDFTYKEVNLTAMNGVLPFRVYAPIEKIGALQYALDFGSKTLVFYEKMFDYGFPLPKCDMAAIPDYSSGATEHWGIVTFRETNIIYNEASSSSQNYQRVSSVIAHEMAHQWFGNLVTLMWWNDLWLNEGFARYIEYKGVDNEHPSWDMKVQFVVDVLQSVFDFDSKLSSHPIVKSVETPEEINAMFDTISYEKGSSVLRMLEGFMSEEYFQKGVNQFLKDFAFKNAVTQDLYDALTEAWRISVPEGNKVDIGDTMNTWTKQMGYPVVNVKRKNSKSLSLTQSRFLKDPKAVYNSSDSPYGYKWDIPISVITSGNQTVQDYWLYREKDELVINIGDNVSWFKVNCHQRGYYRVNYDQEMWTTLEALCAKLALTPEDRSALYDDALALADAALLNYSSALNLSRSLAFESHYVPWKSAARKFRQMEYLLLSTNVFKPFKSYVRELVNSTYESLLWQDEGSHLKRLLRYVIVDISSMSDLESSLTEAGKLLQSWIDNESFPLPLDTKRQIYWWGMIESGSNTNWEIMWSRCMAELDSAQRSNLYYGLSNSQDQNTLNKYINLTFDLNNTKMQDFLNILQYIALNPAGMDLVWDWVRANWAQLESRYGSDDRYLGQLIPSIAQYFSTKQKLKEAEEFYNSVANSGIALQYKNQTLETIKSNIYWVENYSPVIAEWLQSRK